ADPLVGGVRGAEEVLAHGGAQHADRRAGALLALGERAPALERPGARVEQRVGAPRHGGEAAAGAGARLQRARDHRRDPRHRAHAWTAGSIAWGSAALRGGPAPRTPPLPDSPGRTSSRLVPSRERFSPPCTVTPAPIVPMAITAATPITMPSIVSAERSALRRSARSASRTRSPSLTARPRARRPAAARPPLGPCARPSRRPRGRG